jgi:general secretion pathway protein D
MKTKFNSIEQTNNQRSSKQMHLSKRSKLLPISLLFASILLNGCAKKDELKIDLPKKLVEKHELALGSSVIIEPTEKQDFSVTDTPRPPIPDFQQRTGGDEPVNLKGEPIDVGLNQTPLPSFIKIVFGDYLKVDFDIAPDIANRPDLITLRTAEKKTPKQLFALARQVLGSYGVAIKIENGLYRFLGDKAMEGQVPLILRTRSTVDTPEDLRPIFQVIDVHAIDKKEMKKNLDMAFPAKAANISLDESGNAIIAYGTQDTIRGITEAVRMFDRPAFAGRKSVRVNLSYLTADNITGKLLDILQTEGYFVSDDATKKTGITILPIPSLNALLVFAADSTLISHVISWIKELDVSTQRNPEGNYYYVAIRNTEANEIAEVINQALQKQNFQAHSAPRNRRPQPKNQPGKPPVRPSLNARLGGKIVADQDRNALIFYGTAEEFSQVKPLIDQMDVAPRQVLIEVTIAEFNVSDSEQTSFEGFLTESIKNASPQGFSKRLLFSRAQNFIKGFSQASAATDAAATAAAATANTGFNFTVLDNNNQKRAIAQLIATSAHTTVLSNPRLMTRSGAEASFEVGEDVPTLKTRNTTSKTNVQSDSLMVQDVEYKKTGVILEITPVVRAGRRVDIEIVQEVSTPTKSTETSNIDSPTIQKTKVKTKLSLSDGSSILMAGFIRDSKSLSNVGIPFLKDLPAIGRLFRSDDNTDKKREMVLLITPYIVDTDQEASDVTNAFKNRLNWLQ